MRLRQSFLSTLQNPPLAKHIMETEGFSFSSKALRIGSAVDCILTTPDKWEEEFEIKDFTMPYGMMKTFVDNLPPNIITTSPIEVYKDAYSASGYSISIERIIDKFWSSEDALSYYSSLHSGDKIVLSQEEFEAVDVAVNKLLANKYTYKYFRETENELVHQLKVHYPYRGHEMESTLDGVVIDHKNRQIRPFDLKTSGKRMVDFPSSFLSFGYYRQSGLYVEALKYWMEQENEIRDLDYEILPFRFVVVSSNPKSFEEPMVYECSKRDLQAGLKGGYVGKTYYPGIDDLIDAYDYHTSTGDWTLPYLTILNHEGITPLQIFDDNDQD